MIIAELRKIWNAKSLAVVVFMCVLYFITFMRPWVKTDQIEKLQSVDLVPRVLTERFGARIEQDEFQELVYFRDMLIADVDVFIASNPLLAEAGINTFADAQFLMDAALWVDYDTLTEAERIIRDELYDMFLWPADGSLPSNLDAVVAFHKALSVNSLTEAYERRVQANGEWHRTIDFMLENLPFSEHSRQRLIAISDSDDFRSIMGFDVIIYTWSYGLRLAILVILSTLILISPLVTTDKMARVHLLQYSSRAGRKIHQKQLAAMLISTLGLTTVLVLIFSMIFSLNETHVFWNNGLNSFMFPHFYIYSITYGQYTLLLIGVIYLLSIGAASFAFIISMLSKNMTTLLFMIVPFFIIAAVFAHRILTNFLAAFRSGSSFLQIIALVAALVVGLVVAICMASKKGGQ